MSLSSLIDRPKNTYEPLSYEPSSRFISAKRWYQLSQCEPLRIFGGIQLQLPILVEMESTRHIAGTNMLRRRKCAGEEGG